MTRRPVIYDDDQRVDITPPSTGRHQHRSTSSANNTYGHLPFIYYDHIYASTTSSTRLQPHLQPSASTVYSTLLHALSCWITRITHSLGLFGIHRQRLLTKDYLTSTSLRITLDYRYIRGTFSYIFHKLLCATGPDRLINCFIALSCNIVVHSPFSFSEHLFVAGCVRFYLYP